MKILAKKRLEEEIAIYKQQIKKRQEILEQKTTNSIELQFEYQVVDDYIDSAKFFKEEGDLPFDADSKTQMQVMMKEVSDKLAIQDEYLIKKLEMMLKYELPFFATNRRLARNWMIENFIF